MIEIKNVNFSVSIGTPLERAILNGINLKIGTGEFVTVIGTNGAGKSTLLNLISGECLATGGSIEIDGEDATRLSSYQRAHWVARVFQDPLLGSCGELTVAENMALAARRGCKRSLKRGVTHSLRTQYQEVLASLKLGLENRLDTLMNQLSGGQRQAVSLVMSTLSPMKILLLDEHTSALDPKTAEQVMHTTNQMMRENNLTALMVTHSLTQALQHGTRTILLHGGKVARDLLGSERSSLSAHNLLDLYGDTSLG
jgi:putative ABC transport system ATP-binding protein